MPSISIKFHANAEQLEELFVNEEDNNVGTEKVDRTLSTPSISPLSTGKCKLIFLYL